jgi:HK97 family phage prohead protease
MALRDLRNLPQPLLERLTVLFGDDAPGRDARLGVDCTRGSELIEARLVSVPEVRRNDDGTATIDGYATVYDHPYDVAGGPPYGWTEIVAAGAATKSVLERDKVVFLSNHDSRTAWGLPIAATHARTLELESDAVGLRMSSTVNPAADPLTGFIVDRIETKHADAMSFAFRVLRQEWNDDYTERRIVELKLSDVSVVTYPANPATVVQIRDERIAARRSGGPPIEFYIAQADELRRRA